MSFDAGPLGVGGVGLVCSSHARHPTGPSPQYLFSDGFHKGFSETRRIWEHHRRGPDLFRPSCLDPTTRRATSGVLEVFRLVLAHLY